MKTAKWFYLFDSGKVKTSTNQNLTHSIMFNYVKLHSSSLYCFLFIWYLCCSVFSFSESLPKGHQPGNFPRISPRQCSEGRHGSCTPPTGRKLPTPHKQDKESPGLSSRGSSPYPRPRHRSSLSRHSSASDLGTPDVIIEELFDERQEHGVCVCVVFSRVAVHLNNVRSNKV